MLSCRSCMEMIILCPDCLRRKLSRLNAWEAAGILSCEVLPRDYFVSQMREKIQASPKVECDVSQAAISPLFLAIQ